MLFLNNKTLSIIIILFSYTFCYTQKVIDKIVAVVGDKAILLSDLENQKLQASQQGMQID